MRYYVPMTTTQKFIIFLIALLPVITCILLKVLA